MDKDFDKNFVRPGDPDFQYDKRVDFKIRKSGDGGSWEAASSEE